MKQTFTYSLMLFTFLFSNIIQAQISDEQQAQLVNENLITHSLLNQNLSSFSTPNQSTNPSSILLVDNDDDGMEDDWETANNLNPNDPKDAWADADGDQILNLFEFQLATDPTDASSPMTFDISPDDGAATLSSLVNEAEGNLRVIRLSEGQYNAEVLAVFYANFKVMVQGGWNADFSEYNPTEYPVNWHGTDDEALNILTPVSDENVTEATIILEGINFTATNYFSLGGPARASLNSGSGFVSIYNCTAIGNEYYGFAVSHKNQAGHYDVFIAKNVVGNNLKGGFYTQITDSATGRWRFFNTTINNPNSSQGGIDGLTLEEGELAIEMTNCINRNNGVFSLNFFSNNVVSFAGFHTNIDEFAPSIEVLQSINVTDVDANFENPAGEDWTLTNQSPCIDTGIDVGFPYSNAAPDLGALEFDACTNSQETLTVNACEPYDFNGETLTISGTYIDTLTNITGCDSLITLELEFELLDVSVTQDEALLTANMEGADYLWINCATNDVVGENQMFVPLESGEYAVIVSGEFCSETSDCYSVIINSTLETSLENKIYLFPNPSQHGAFTLNWETPLSTDTEVKIFSVKGELILTNILSKGIYSWRSEHQLPTGVYSIRISNDYLTETKRLLVAH